MAGQLKQSQKFFANGVALQDNNRKKKELLLLSIKSVFFLYSFGKTQWRIGKNA